MSDYSLFNGIGDISLSTSDDFYLDDKDDKSSNWQSIYDFSIDVFETLKNIVSIPFRYLGSKTWSLPGLILRLPQILLFPREGSISEQLFGKGYHYQLEVLSPQQAEPFVRNACIATSVAKCDTTWFELYGLQVLSPIEIDADLSTLPGQIEWDDVRYLDRTTGLKAMVVSNEDEVVISFGALEGAKADFDEPGENPYWKSLVRSMWGSAIGNLAGVSPAIYSQAEALFLAIKNDPELAGKKITLIGHCLGGSIASYIALKNHVQAQGFNTLPLGVGLQQDIGEENLRNAENYVTHLSVNNDFCSDSPLSSLIDRVLNLLGLKTPGNFGNHYRVPAAPGYSTQAKIHNFFVGSIMHHLGFNCRWKPLDLINADYDLP